MQKKQTFSHSFWIFFSAVLVTAIAAMSVLYLTGISSSPAFLAILGSVITAIGAGSGTLIKSMLKYKTQIKEQTRNLEEAVEDMQDLNAKELNKTQESLLIKQLDFNQKTTDFLIDSFLKIEKGMNIISNDVKATREDLNAKFNEVQEDVISMQIEFEASEKTKSKQEKWMLEIHRDWESCKKRIQTIDKKTLFSSAVIIKENFTEFFQQVVEMDLSASDRSSKELLVININEKLDCYILNRNLQLDILLKDNKMHEDFNKAKAEIIYKYRQNIEKCFNENIINNIYRNFYNYSSIYFNDLLNQLVRSYFKTKEQEK